MSRSALGHEFGNPQLLEQALTHRSFGPLNNERLEFLGDGLVNLLVAELLFEQHARASEGELTRMRASLVNGATLAEVARNEVIGERLRLGAGELKSGGFRRDSILADAFEALLAAIYLDAGWDACRSVVRRLFAARAMAAGTSGTPKDAKTRLQELLQGRGLPLPVYTLTASVGEDHAKIFETACSIADLDLHATGQGSSRRAAEQSAAAHALELALERFAHER
ncbi:MAG TPA: ribonuclease III [Rhodanobacteraceae bacterium]|nr:ribonuclease III [Rhodanobacteraceae bacterium]